MGGFGTSKQRRGRAHRWAAEGPPNASCSAPAPWPSHASALIAWTHVLPHTTPRSGIPTIAMAASILLFIAGALAKL